MRISDIFGMGIYIVFSLVLITVSILIIREIIKDIKRKEYLFAIFGSFLASILGLFGLFIASVVFEVVFK
jgi:hypothetical protein